MIQLELFPWLSIALVIVEQDDDSEQTTDFYNDPNLYECDLFSFQEEKS